MHIEQDGDRMHAHHAQDPVREMPQITRPDSFGVTAIDQVAADRVNAIPHSPQHGTPTVGGLMPGGTVGRQQDNAQTTQLLLEPGQPRVTISQQQPVCAFRQVQDALSLMHIGWSQTDGRDDKRPRQTRMQAKAVEGLAAGLIFAIARLSTEAPAPGSARKQVKGSLLEIDQCLLCE